MMETAKPDKAEQREKLMKEPGFEQLVKELHHTSRRSTMDDNRKVSKQDGVSSPR